MALVADGAIEQITENKLPYYEPYSCHHWPEHPWLPYQFRRGLGETQEGGGSVSEVFQAASRMIPDDLESWHAEWKIGDRNWRRGLDEEAAGHIRTAMNCMLRAADYYRQAEFHLEPEDPRRLPVFEAMEACSKHGAIWDVREMWRDKGEDFGLAMHIKGVMGAPPMKAAMEKARAFTLDGHLQIMRCPSLILHGGYDVLTVSAPPRCAIMRRNTACRSHSASSSRRKPAPSTASMTTRPSARKFCPIGLPIFSASTSARC
jgi:hypothetical protein